VLPRMAFRPGMGKRILPVDIPDRVAHTQRLEGPQASVPADPRPTPFSTRLKNELWLHRTFAVRLGPQTERQPVRRAQHHPRGCISVVSDLPTIREILSRHGRLSVDVRNLKDDSDLYSAGLTSLATVNVMLALEDH